MIVLHVEVIVSQTFLILKHLHSRKQYEKYLNKQLKKDISKFLLETKSTNLLVRELNMFEVDTVIQEGSDSEQGKSSSSSSDSRARIGSKKSTACAPTLTFTFTFNYMVIYLLSTISPIPSYFNKILSTYTQSYFNP